MPATGPCGPPGLLRRPVWPAQPAHLARLAWLACVMCVTLLLLAQAHAQPNAGKRVALLIGNQNYAHEKVLVNPVNDATLLGGVLRDELKFDLVRVERNLNLAAMDRVLDQFVADARGAATVVFYFSGHGLTSASDDEGRVPYLLPVDARTGSGALRLDRQALSVKALRNRLQALGAPVTLLFLDACRDGPSLGRSGSKGLALVGGGPRLLLSYATEEGRIAEDGAGANSPYAAALAQAWRQPQLTVLEQLDLVYDAVTQRHPQQRPVYEGNVRASARLSPFGAMGPQEQARVEDEAWALCRAGSTPIPCIDYLATWPQGRYTGLARTRLREMEAQQQRQQQAAGAGAAGPAVAGVAAPAPGTAMRDCAECPELVVVGGGRFLMGSPADEPERSSNEGPQREVVVGAFALGRTEVTFAQWDACVAAGGCSHRPGDQGWGRGQRPVIFVSWEDAQQYVKWLSGKTGQRYLVPSEAQWEYAARAGTTTPFSTGRTITTGQANFDGRGTYSGSAQGEYRQRTVPVGSFTANSWGLQDMQGNVREWVHDCYDQEAYSGKAPSDGRPYEVAGCSLRVLRGGSWYSFPQFARAAYRVMSTPVDRNSGTGFRLARMLP